MRETQVVLLIACLANAVNIEAERAKLQTQFAVHSVSNIISEKRQKSGKGEGFFDPEENDTTVGSCAVVIKDAGFDKADQVFHDEEDFQNDCALNYRKRLVCEGINSGTCNKNTRNMKIIRRKVESEKFEDPPKFTLKHLKSHKFSRKRSVGIEFIPNITKNTTKSVDIKQRNLPANNVERSKSALRSTNNLQPFKKSPIKIEKQAKKSNQKNDSTTKKVLKRRAYKRLDSIYGYYRYNNTVEMHRVALNTDGSDCTSDDEGSFKLNNSNSFVDFLNDLF